MVPGMTARDRLATEMRVCLWLHDAAIGPTRANPLAQLHARDRNPWTRLLRFAWQHCQHAARALAGDVQWGERPLPGIGSQSGD